MTEENKNMLLAMIKGLTKEKGGQLYTEKYIDEAGIKTLTNFIKSM